MSLEIILRVTEATKFNGISNAGMSMSVCLVWIGSAIPLYPGPRIYTFRPRLVCLPNGLPLPRFYILHEFASEWRMKLQQIVQILCFWYELSVNLVCHSVSVCFSFPSPAQIKTNLNRGLHLLITQPTFEPGNQTGWYLNESF